MVKSLKLSINVAIFWIIKHGKNNNIVFNLHFFKNWEKGFLENNRKISFEKIYCNFMCGFLHLVYYRYRAISGAPVMA